MLEGSSAVIKVKHNCAVITCVYQGPATAPDGQRAFFIIYGHDTLSVQQGTYMRMWSHFRDEDRREREFLRMLTPEMLEQMIQKRIQELVTGKSSAR